MVSEEAQYEMPIVTQKDILSTIVTELADIFKCCTTVEHFWKSVDRLAKYTRLAAETNQDTTIQLTLEDFKEL